MNYFALVGQEEIGPLSVPQVRRLAETGRLQPHHSLRAENSAEWVTASNVRGLFVPLDNVVSPTPTAPAVTEEQPSSREFKARMLVLLAWAARELGLVLHSVGGVLTKLAMLLRKAWNEKQVQQDWTALIPPERPKQLRAAGGLLALACSAWIVFGMFSGSPDPHEFVDRHGASHHHDWAGWTNTIDMMARQQPEREATTKSAVYQKAEKQPQQIPQLMVGVNDSSGDLLSRGNPLFNEAGQVIGHFAGVDRNTGYSPDSLLGLEKLRLVVVGPADGPEDAFFLERGISKEWICRILEAEFKKGGLVVGQNVDSSSVLVFRAPMMRVNARGAVGFSLHGYVYRPAWLCSESRPLIQAAVYRSVGLIGSVNGYALRDEMAPILRLATQAIVEDVNRAKRIVGPTVPKGGYQHSNLKPGLAAWTPAVIKGTKTAQLIVEETFGADDESTYIAGLGVTSERIQRIAQNSLRRGGLELRSPEQLAQMPGTIRPPTIYLQVQALRMGELDGIVFSVKSELMHVFELAHLPGRLAIGRIFASDIGLGTADSATASARIDHAVTQHLDDLLVNLAE